VTVGGRTRQLLLALLLVIASLPLSPFRSLAAGCDATGAPATTTVYLPNVTKTLGGPAGWVTPFYVQNAGGLQTAIDVSFFRFSDGSLVVCRRTSGLAPGISLVDNPNADADLPNDTQFSVVIKSYGAPVVAIVNQLQGSGSTQQALSYSGFTQGAATVYLPNVTRRFFGYDVPFIVQSLGTQPATVTARFVSFAGTETYTKTMQVASGRSGVIDPDFEPASTGTPGSGLTDGTQYAVTLTSTQPIAVVVNAHNEQGSPVAFSHNGLAAGGTSLFAPYATKGPSLFSPVVVQNLGTTPVNATLTFAPLAGGAAQTFTLTAIPAGGSRAFDPRFTLGTTVPCATAFVGACLGAGDYALTIAAPTPIAAVVLPNSATTAAGYLASAAPSPRALLPVVLRTIGGASGWTSTTYIQSTTASTATVRWFSIETGDLVTTQTLTLVPGATTKLDPRTVTGLADNSQYSVTVDGNGPIVAIVFEQAATGGDAAMLYEGFAMQPLAAFAGQPASLKVAPASLTITMGSAALFTPTVRDAFGAVVPATGMTATIVPASLGNLASSLPAGFTITTQGPGTGTITFTLGQLSTVVPITVTPLVTQTIGGISFVVQTSGTVDLYTEVGMSVLDRFTITSQAAADVAQISVDYGRPYTKRPVVYVLGTTPTYTTALQTIFGLSPQQASGVGQSSAGLFIEEPAPRVGVDWAKIGQTKPITALRHELTHWMEHQIVTSGALPAWFDEGNARVEEFTLAGSLYRAMQNKYGAASMAQNNLLPTLGQMTGLFEWNARPSPLGYYQYFAASQAVLFLRQDIGMAGELRMFDLLAQGQSFDAAYATVSGQPFANFANAYSARVRALAPGYPGIATAPDTVEGGGLTMIVYGLPPNAPFTMTVSGGSPGPHVADQYGVYASYLGSTWPPGAYTISVSWSGGTITTSAVKTSSVSDSSIDAGETGPLELLDLPLVY
jgi:hypothetical protein